MVDLRPFQSAIEKAKADTYVGDPRTVFLNVLINSKYMVHGAIKVNELERIDSPNDKRRGDKSGWYIYKEFASDYGEGQVIGSALYGCWKDGETHKWQSVSDKTMSPKERLAFHTAREVMREQYEKEKKKQHEDSAKFAFEIWEKSAPATGHDYLTAKGITASDGVRLASDGRLIVPVVSDNQVISLQFIDNVGTKRFLKGGKTKGGYFKIEGTEANKVYIGEGYATARSVSMATNCPCYAAFSCHNLLETAMVARNEYPQAHIVILGEHGNGDKEARQAAEAVAGDAMFTPDPECTDFNDYHNKHGLDAVRKEVYGAAQKVYEKKPKQDDEKFPYPTGALLDIYNYYNATSGNEQHGFAIQTALALASIATGRAYRTDYNNYTSLYFMCVAKSGTGKEHPKTVVENILYSANMGDLIGGDGYTSAGAVFSALLDKPRHITIIDELGRYLEAGKEGGKGGNHHQREANTKIMESFGRSHGVLRPPTYSTMTLNKDQASAVRNRMVYNPSITVLGMSTPDTLFKSLDMGAIKDGFVNRFIISISDAERAIRKHKPPVEVPQRIISWLETIAARYDGDHTAAEPSTPITLNFTSEAYEEQIKMQEYCIETANALDRFGMSELPGRANEIAMRISLLCALSENPMAETIEQRHMEWGAKYARSHLEDTISRLKVTISGSDFERNKKEILADLRERGEDGITWTEMQKNAPYSKHTQKELKEVLQALKDAELAFDETYQNPKGGRPTAMWKASA